MMCDCCSRAGIKINGREVDNIYSKVRSIWIDGRKIGRVKYDIRWHPFGSHIYVKLNGVMQEVVIGVNGYAYPKFTK